MPISICVIRIMPTIIIVILSNAFVFETIFRHEIPITNSQLYPFKFFCFLLFQFRLLIFMMFVPLGFLVELRTLLSVK